MRNFRVPLLASLLGLVSTVAAVRPLVVKGSQFVLPETNTRFQIVGVDYQPGGASAYGPDNKQDVLADAQSCLRDAILLQRLGVNAIRVYNVNPDLNHDECMSIFNAAGIYLILDVNSPLVGESLPRHAPWEGYFDGYLERIFRVVEAFMDYPNTLALFGGNEVINEDAHKEVPAYLRAVQRDLKEYIKLHSPRPIPVGYSAADVREILEDTWNYVSCDLPESPSSRADFFGLNSYSWCGDSSYKISGYDKLVEMFQSTANPIFFSEYGCNEVTPRIFTEVAALYGEEMTKVFGGGLIYEYSQEANNYGLVEIQSDGSVKLLGDYDNLMEQYLKLDVEMLNSLDVPGSESKPPRCNANLIKTKGFLKEFKVPKLPPGGAELIKAGVSNPNRGKLVEVTATTTETTITDPNGDTITGLELKIVDDDKWNVPGDNTSGGTRTSGANPTQSAMAGNTVTAGTGSVLAAIFSFFLLA